MQVNFFGWLREGVKRSVMLGVSDAVEELGAPDGDSSQQQLLKFLREGDKSSGRKPRGGQRRLGRTLKDIQSPNEAANEAASPQ